MSSSDGSSMLLLGVPLIVGGCFSSAAGLLLMKRSGELEAGLPFFLAWRWLCGFACLAVVQTACDALSLSYLPLSVVAPFAGARQPGTELRTLIVPDPLLTS